MIPILVAIAGRYAQRTGKTLHDALREVGDYFRGIKIQHTGERPSCRICGTPATCGSTLKQDGVTERFYKCHACGTPLKTYEETPPEEAVKSTKRAPTSTPPAHIQEGTRKKKRKRS